jgi:hypothetical protein
MANTDDLVSSYVARLDELIDSRMVSLVSAKREDRDNMAGYIAGMMGAKKEFEGLARKWRMQDGEDE